MKAFTHIRDEDYPRQNIRLCGSTTGGTISLKHYRKQPEHVESLHICKGCEMHLAKTSAKLRG